MNITELFKSEELKENSKGDFKTVCPCCGLQGDRTAGFILFTETNTAYCHSSHKWFTLLETAALKLKIIQCIDGNDKGEKPDKLKGEIFIQILKGIEDEYGEEFLNKLKTECNLEIFYKKEWVKRPGNNRLISNFVKDLCKPIKNKNILFYRNELKQIVEIRKIKLLSNNDKKQMSFSIINPNRFITLIENFVIPYYEYWDDESKKMKRIEKSIINSLAAITLESQTLQDSLPVIERIFTIPIPIIYNNELTFPKIGYDKRFNSWLSYDSPKIEKPNMKLEDAKKIIEELFSEFCFQENQDKINAIAALLTPLLRGLFSTFHIRTPVSFYLSNRERAGKDYLAGITGLVYEGYATEEPAISYEDRNMGVNEELKKKFLAALIAGRKRMHFSNNKGHLNNAIFEGFVTLEKFSDRLLGKNEILEFYNEMDFSLSGNIGITFTPDFANRSRFIRLFLDIEDANARKFNNPKLHQTVKEKRGLILSALYTLIRNWIKKEKPKGSLPFASFPEWAEICGGIMEAAEYDSPCKTDKNILSLGGDKETSNMKKLFECCYEKNPDKYLTKAEIMDIIKDEDLFEYYDFSSRGDQTKFGNILIKFVGRYLSEILLDVQNMNIQASRRLYKFTKKYFKNLAKEKKSIVNHDNLNNLDNPMYIGLSKNSKNKGVILKDGEVIKVIIGENDREIQFYDAKECKNIKPNHTKQDILNWIKQHKKWDYKMLYKKFGIGCLKFRNELKIEGKI